MSSTQMPSETSLPALNTFSFRAECPDDVMRFLGQSYIDPDHPSMRDVFTVHMERPTVDADVMVEIQADTSVSIDTVRAWMRQVVDSHVMLQTLRQVPLSGNSLEREPDYARAGHAG